MVVVTLPVPTVAEELVRETEKVSSASAKRSGVVVREKERIRELTGRSVTPVFVAVTIRALLLPALVASERPEPAVSALASSAVKSKPFLAERPAASPRPWASRVKVTLRPTPRPTPLRSTL
jgi:hypothetical protein